jgi:hypothetical protein
MLTLFGLIPAPFHVSTIAVIVQIIITLFFPLLAAIAPDCRDDT